jgi:hypothetical protein
MLGMEVHTAEPFVPEVEALCYIPECSSFINTAVRTSSTAFHLIRNQGQEA